jgi:nucleoside 2-deoxyribosyltransferase
MNTLKVYLAGAIWEAKDPVSWRRAVTDQLPAGWEAIDPTQIELFVENEHADENARRVVETDLEAIRSCDAVIAMISQPSWGTAMEIFYAHCLGIPVLGWNPHPAGKKVGPWVKFHCYLVSCDFDIVKGHLQTILAEA